MCFTEVTHSSHRHHVGSHRHVRSHPPQRITTGHGSACIHRSVTSSFPGLGAYAAISRVGLRRDHCGDILTFTSGTETKEPFNCLHAASLSPGDRHTHTHTHLHHLHLPHHTQSHSSAVLLNQSSYTTPLTINGPPRSDHFQTVQQSQEEQPGCQRVGGRAQHRRLR